MSMTIRQIERKIERIKEQLMTLGPMRPGAISQQYRKPREKKNPYYQISYTHQMKSRSEYVRREHLATLRAETKNFRRFRELTEQWVDLSLELSRLKIGRMKARADSVETRAYSGQRQTPPTIRERSLS
ncbi:MAG: hypothetical protein EOM20_03800 [Spartobacteria bacterium]|nr:hypothetical protein [Spartobacteria bacterium]